MPARLKLPRWLAATILVMLFAPNLWADSADGCERLEVFVAPGCPHCADAKRTLAHYQLAHPDLAILYFDVSNADAERRFLGLAQQHAVRRPGVPAFHACGQFFVGFPGEQRLALVLDALLSGQHIDFDEPGIDLPVFGYVALNEHGLAAFTVAVGLVDGFNPCAMWVLLFLLSILLHVKSRVRMALIAGGFVLVSGLVYFLIMAAWFNVFLMIGYVRAVQVALASLAMLIGAVHLKDAVAPGVGLSFSIPERYKPSIFRRVREVVQAEHLLAAVAGVAALAVMVNVVELLCTAGLPALYTQILAQQALTVSEYYGYLALYNLAYVLDDGLMVAVAVTTFSQVKLQTRQGRVLKLLSGTLMAALGALLLLAPHWLF